jgi:phage terminase large subunit-like protein
MNYERRRKMATSTIFADITIKGRAEAERFIKAIEEATDWNMVPVRQGSLSLNEPTKWLQEAFVEGRVSMLDDTIMKQSLMNAVIVSDNNGIKIDKNKATLKIDLVDATIDALYQGIYHFEDFSDINDDVERFKRMSDEQINDYFTKGDFSF